MSDVNHVTLSGRLTRGVELRKTGSGTAVADVSIANNRYSKAKQQFTVFPKVTLWDKQAEWASANLSVGDNVFITGQLVDDNFERDGVKTSGRMKIDNARIQLLRKKVITTTVEEIPAVEEPTLDEVETPIV